MFRFKCNFCDAWHEGMPSYGYVAPLYYYTVPESERMDRCELGSDTCVVDQEFFFVRGCLDIPVHGENDLFSWGVWVSLSRESFAQFLANYEKPIRSHIGPFFGWLSSELPLYPNTVNLKTHVHLRDHGTRPFIELEQTDHPLAVEQRDGIDVKRVSEIYEYHAFTKG